VIPWKIVRRQLASVDQFDRRLALSLNRVAGEIRADSPDFLSASSPARTIL